MDYIEVSAMENHNILQAINLLARDIFNEKELWKMESREKANEMPLAKLKGLIAGETGAGAGGIIGSILNVVTCTKREKEKKIVLNPDDIDSDMQSGDDDIQENIDDDQMVDGDSDENSDEEAKEKKCSIS